MITRTTLSPAIRSLASHQSGALSAEQLHCLGISTTVIRRLRTDGTLTNLARGVYAMWPGDWMQSAWGAVLAGGDHAVIGGMAAAYLHGLVPEPPAVIDCYCGATSHRDNGPWRFIRADRSGQGDPAKTSLTWTLIDASRELDADAIASMVARARRRLRLADVVKALDTVYHHPRRADLLEALGYVAEGAESALEVRYARDVERYHGLPVSQRQQHPGRSGRADFWYSTYGVLVETDGQKFHQGIAASGDAARDNAHLELGIVTLRFTWSQVRRDSCRVARQVAVVLQRGGWRGEPKPCRRCPPT